MSNSKPMSTTIRSVMQTASSLVTGWIGRPRVTPLKDQINHLLVGLVVTGIYILVCWVHSSTTIKPISIVCYDTQHEEDTNADD